MTSEAFEKRNLTMTSEAEKLAQHWRSRLTVEHPEQSEASRESIICWLIGDDSAEFETLSLYEQNIAKQAMEYRYRILAQRYLGQSKERAYRNLLTRLGSLVTLRNKIQTWISLSRDRQRSVLDVLQEVLQELLQSDTYIQKQMTCISKLTTDRRLQNALLFASIEEYCLRPVRNQPLLVYRFVNYLRRTQRGGLTQVPSSDNVRLVSEEVLTEDNENPVNLLDVRALAEYKEAQELEDQQTLQQLVKQEFENYLQENIGLEAVEWLRLYLQGKSQDAIAKKLNKPIHEVYRLREKISYHAVRVFALKGKPELVDSWLSTSLLEHDFGLTQNRLGILLEQLTAIQRQILELRKAGEPIEAIAQQLKLKTHQVMGEWTKISLLAQSLRSSDAIPAKEAVVSYEILLTALFDSVSIGEEIEIIVYLNALSRNNSNVSNKNIYLLEIPQDTIIGSELNIILTAPGFQFDDDNTTSLPLDTDTGQVVQTASFRLTALRPGLTKIKAELYCGNTFKTTLETEVEVTVFEDTKIRSLVAARSRPISQPDIILQIRTTWNEDISACTFNYQIETFQPRLLFTDDVDYNSQSLSAALVETTQQLLKTTLEEAASSLLEDFRSRLASLGQYLFKFLLPDELQSTFRTIAGFNRPFTLLILADPDAWFPWDLLHDGQKFFGEYFIIGRWLWELDKIRPYEFPVGAVNVAHYANVEQPEVWTTLLAPPGAPPPISLLAGILSDLQFTESMQGLHLIRFGKSLDETDKRDAPVQVSDSSDVHDIETEVQPAKLSLRRNRPLVTLSYLSAGQPELTVLEQTWAATFLRAGCSTFVGPLWAVQPNVEAAFVSTFYNSIWAGQSLGMAFQTARRLARAVAPDSLDWLAYILFGDPMARPYQPVEGQGYAVVEPIGQEIDDPVPPGSTVRFRVSLRRTPPVWYENRLMEVAENLTFDDLHVFIVTSGLQVTPDDSIVMKPTATGDYLGWFTLTVPTEMKSQSILVQVYFEDAMEPVHSLRFSLKVGNRYGEQL